MAVVLFPLVPVTATIGAWWKSSSQTASGVVTTTPPRAASTSSGRYLLTPGDRTMVSAAASTEGSGG